MQDKIVISSLFKYLLLSAIGIGLVSFVTGLFLAPERIWASYLLSNYYFLSLTIGALFFAAIQSISQSGWSAAFKRIPEALGTFLPFAGLLMLLLYFGLKYIYPWANSDLVSTDEIIKNKTPYLNTIFWIIRLIVFFGLWTLLSRSIRKESLKEDIHGGLTHFNRTELLSKIFIFVLAITFSLGTFDWMMSIDTKWFSTIYALLNFIAGFQHAVALIGLIIIILNKLGYFKFFNNTHLSEYSNYIFMLSMLWAYFWFCQYLLIWFANIPEETIYYHPRIFGEFKIVFMLSLIFNFIIPFVVFLVKKVRKSKLAFIIVASIMLVGMWLDIYAEVMPGSVGSMHIGIYEIGVFIGFAGLFLYLFAQSLSKASLIPVNHPYLSESLAHK